MSTITRLHVGDRVSATRLGYGSSAGKRVTGTVRSSSYKPGGPGYIHVVWDDGKKDFGFVHTFRNLKKVKAKRRTYAKHSRSYTGRRR